MSNNLYTWTDNPTVSGVAVCDTDILNDCLMHLKYDKQDGNGFPLFTPMIFDHVLSGNDAVGWALQGSVISNTYPEAVSKIQELYTEGVETQYRNITCKRSVDGRYIADIEQKPAIDQLFTLTGIADFYIWDSINQQFYLPRTKWFNQMTLDTTMVNNYNEPGLPNIEGDIVTNAYTSSLNTGAFANQTRTDNHGGGTDPRVVSGFDASLCSSVYGNSTTVQPPSSNKLLYYKVGNTLTNESEIDVANLTNDVLNVQNSLTNKADANLGNCTKPYVTETYENDYSWYRLWSDGWLEQGGLSSTGGASRTINLPKSYKTGYYYVGMSVKDSAGYTCGFISSPDYFTAKVSNANIWFVWYSCGYSSIGE